MNYEQTNAVVEKQEWARVLMEWLCEQEHDGAFDTFDSLHAYLKAQGYERSTRQISNVLKRIAGFDRERHKRHIAKARAALREVEDAFDCALEDNPGEYGPKEWETIVYHVFSCRLDEAQKRVEEAEERLQRERTRVEGAKARVEAVRAYRRMQQARNEQQYERLDLVSSWGGTGGEFFISPIHLAAIDLREMAEELGVSFDKQIKRLGLDPENLR